MRFLVLCVVGLIWASTELSGQTAADSAESGLIWASKELRDALSRSRQVTLAPNPEEVQGRWVQLFGFKPKDSLVVMFHTDGRFEMQRVDMEYGLDGLEVRGRWTLKGTWTVRAPVEGEGRDTVVWGAGVGKDMVLCTRITFSSRRGSVTPRITCQPYSIEESPDRFTLFRGWNHYERLKT